jgi:CheY-like chemotaxis protein
MQTKPFVLVIEDTRDIAEIYAEILELEGMLVEMIVDGAVALQRLETALPDLVLLDMHLPNISGLEILAFIRNNARLKKTKVIVITANAHLAQDAEHTADITLVKPVSATQVRELSTRMLHHRVS